MPYNVVSISVVKQDIADALEYYNSISLKLALRFGDDLLNTLNRLEANPQHYFNLDKGFRRVNLSEFPYMILYSIDQEHSIVKVSGVFHQHSNPAFIKRRMKVNL